MKTTKKILSLVLVVLMFVSVIPIGASAESQRDAIVRIALAEEGTSGCPNKYTYAYGQIGGTYNWGWCAAFIYWCAQQAGIPHSIIGRTASASVNSFNTPYYSYSSSSNVQKGDILYLTNNYGNHVGLVYAVDATYIYTIEGNMGNAVKKYKYRRSDGYITWSSSSEWQRITHYGVPNYNGTHSHSYLSHYEADHPHRVYNKCSCGDWHYTGGTQYVSSCSQCNEPTKIVYPTDGGIYKIASGVGNNMYLDFACTNTNVQIYENCDGHSNPDFVKSQYYKLTHVGDGWYTVVNPANGKAMDVYDWRTASGTNIQQWDLHSGDCQLFRFYDAGDGYCYIKSKLGTYVDVQDGNNVSNTNVWAYAFNGSNAQKWKIQTHSHSYSSTVTKAATCTATGVKTFTCYCGVSYTETINKLEHTNSWDDNKCDVCGTVLIAEPTKILYPENNQIVKIQTAIGSDKFLNADLWSENIRIYENLDGNSDVDLIMSQYFKITHVGDGWYTIVNIGNGNAMDVESFNTASKTNVKHYTLHGGDNQLFRFYDAGDGYYYIKSKLGCYLDVDKGQNANNVNVQMHTFNGGGAQKWKLINHSHSYISSIGYQNNIDKVVKTFECYCGSNYTEVIAENAYSTVYKGTTYILYDGSMPYADAKEFCKKIGGHLVKITSQEENDVVAGLITTFGHISWINGTDEIEEGTWCFDDGEEMPYFNWDEGEPNSHQGNDQDYLAMNIRTKWDDYHGSAYGFVCEIEHTEHYYISSITTQPTCTKEGVKTYKCSCGDSYTESIDKKPHTIVVIPAVTSTCTKTGLTEGKKCSICGTVTVAQQVTTKKDHTEVIDNAVSATCSKTGLTEGKHCSVCNTVTVAQQTVATVSHIDNSGDYLCDFNCGYEFDKPAEPTPEVPEEPDTPNKDCSCMCHKSGLIGIIWKILRFFYKIFKINPVCGCGVYHY